MFRFLSIVDRGILPIIKKRRIKNALREKGFSDEQIKYMLFAIEYATMSERDKKKLKEQVRKEYPHKDIEESDATFNALLIEMLSYMDVAELIIRGKKKALEVHEYAQGVFEEMKRIDASSPTGNN